RHAPLRPAHQLPLADMHLGLYGFELPRLAFSRKALDALLAAPRITVPGNPLPTAIFHETQPHCDPPVLFTECIQYRRKAGLQRRELDPERFGLGLMRP